MPTTSNMSSGSVDNMGVGVGVFEQGLNFDDALL